MTRGRQWRGQSRFETPMSGTTREKKKICRPRRPQVGFPIVSRRTRDASRCLASALRHFHACCLQRCVPRSWSKLWEWDLDAFAHARDHEPWESGAGARCLARTGQLTPVHLILVSFMGLRAKDGKRASESGTIWKR